jgi:hypothetical protein
LGVSSPCTQLSGPSPLGSQGMAYSRVGTNCKEFNGCRYLRTVTRLIFIVGQSIVCNAYCFVPFYISLRDRPWDPTDMPTGQSFVLWNMLGAPMFRSGQGRRRRVTALKEGVITQEGKFRAWRNPSGEPSIDRVDWTVSERIVSTSQSTKERLVDIRSAS